MRAPIMPGDRHKLNPVTFRPTEANRVWLRDQPGPVNAVINRALDALREGRSDMTACLRCGEPKPADGDDWCGRCEDENAAEVVAAMDGLFDGPD